MTTVTKRKLVEVTFYVDATSDNNAANKVLLLLGKNIPESSGLEWSLTVKP